MKNGSCSECNSTEIYYATSEDAQGLRDEHSINVRIAGLANAAVVGIRKSKHWKQVT
jgi:hypothetical protein